MKNSELERLIKSAFGSPGFSTQATNADWEKMESLLGNQKPAAAYSWLPYGAIAASVATIGVAIMMYFNDADIPQYAHLSRITSPIETADLLPSSITGAKQFQFTIRETTLPEHQITSANAEGNTYANLDRSANTSSVNEPSRNATALNQTLDKENQLTDPTVGDYTWNDIRKNNSINIEHIELLDRLSLERLPVNESYAAKNVTSIKEKEASLLHLEVSLLGGAEFTSKTNQAPLVNRSIQSDLSLTAAATPTFGGQVALIKNNFAISSGITFGTLRQGAQLNYSTEQASIETYTTTRIETSIDSTLIDHFLKPYHNPETGRLELTYEETYAYDTTTTEHVEEHQQEVIDTLQHAWSGQVVVSSFRIPLTLGYRKPLGKWTLMANGGMQFSVNKVNVVSDEPATELSSVLNVVEQEVRSSLTPSISFMASVGAGYQLAPQWRVDAAVKSSLWQDANQTHVLPSAQIGLTYSLF